MATHQSPSMAGSTRRNRWRIAMMCMAVLLLVGGLTPTAAAAALSPAAPTPAAAAGDSSISGQVTDALTGAPVEGACVTAMVPQSADAPPNVTACTGADGTYHLAGLVAGAPYTVRVRQADSVYLSEYYGGGHGEDWGTIVFPADGQAVGIDIALDHGGRISGTVTDTAGMPLAGVCVSVSGYLPETDDMAIDSDCTGADGTYSVVGIAGAELYMTADDRAGPYLPVQGTPDGSILVVTPDEHRTGIDYVLEHGATVSATLVDSAGAPLAGVCVLLEPVADWWFGHEACSDSSGVVRSAGAPAGDYRVVFASSGFGIPRQYYPGTYDADQATIVTLSPPDTAELGTVTILSGGSISGHITLSGGADPSHSCISTTSTSGSMGFGSACVGSDGAFTLVGLAPGTYTLTVDGPWDQDYLKTQYVNPVTGSTEVTVSEGQALAGIDVTLALGGSIAGTVTDEAGQPIASAFIRVYHPLTAENPWWPDSANLYAAPDASGSYLIRAVPPGDYLLEASGMGHVSEVYQDAATFNAATKVTASPGIPTTGIDFSLAVAHDLYVSATVNGQALAGVEVSLYPDTGGPAMPIGTTGDTGQLTADVTAPGSYKMGCHDPQGRYPDTYYFNVPDLASATSIYLSHGMQFHASCLFSATVTGSITGTVTDAITTAPIPGAVVTAYPVDGGPSRAEVTDPTGAYAIRDLPAGDYRVEFTDPSGRHLTQWYAGAASQADAWIVTVPTQQTALDAALQPALGSLTGTVTDAVSLLPIAGVQVHVLGPDGSTVSESNSAADGTYLVGQLPAGSYTVHFTDPSGRYAEQWYAGASSAGAATTITMPQDLAGVDAALAPVRNVSGTVTDSATGAPIAGVTVSLTAVGADTATATATTASDGTYEIAAPPVGTYLVGFTDPQQRGYLPEFYSGATTAAAATPLVIADSSRLEHIDATLDRPGSITGTVVAGGGPKERVCVTVWSAEGVPAAPEVCVASGASYAVTGLVPGTYRVSVVGPSKQATWYLTAGSYASATPVTVTSGQKVTNIDITARGKAKG